VTNRFGPPVISVNCRRGHFSLLGFRSTEEPGDDVVNIQQGAMSKGLKVEHLTPVGLSA